jgi:predicted transcriptional regulator
MNQEQARNLVRQTASEYLQELEKLGILKGEKQGREVIYKHPALLKILTA